MPTYARLPSANAMVTMALRRAESMRNAKARRRKPASSMPSSSYSQAVSRAEKVFMERL